MKKIVFTGGGTAGHIVPNFAIIDEIKSQAEVYYIGSNGLEKNLVKEKGITFYEIPSTKLKRSLSLSNLIIPFKLINSIFKAKKILKKIQPDKVFSKGGYVSLPVVIAAKNLKIPVISHESDLTMGLANKLVKNKSQVICTSFEKTAQNLKNGLYTGTPLRKEIFLGNKENAKKLFKNYTERPTILVFGGSLGSKTINKVIINSLDKLNKFNIIHIVGKNNLNDIKKDNYVCLEYTNSIGNLFALSSLVISRAGSTSINELLYLNKPNILIPLSKKASRGDQLLNSEYFKEKGYSKVILEENLSTKTLLQTINSLMQEKEKYIQNMKNAPKPNATQKIVTLLLS